MISTIIGDEVYYHRGFVTLLGGVKPAIMLSFAIQKQQMEKAPVWRMTEDEWFRETGLNPSEQRAARRILKRYDFWIDTWRGTPLMPSFGVRVEDLLKELGVVK